jgi:putative toxin-antitoxin system antitoxin component (TIGR02293 family)
MGTSKSAIRTYRPGSSEERVRVETFAPSEVYKRLGLIKSDRSELVRVLRIGVAVSVFAKLAEEIGTSQAALGKVIGLPSSTLTRRRQSKRLSPDESDRLYRVASVYRSALQLFEGDRAAARRWLNASAKALGGSSPVEYLDTEAGAEAVQDLILRLEHGVVT